MNNKMTEKEMGEKLSALLDEDAKKMAKTMHHLRMVHGLSAHSLLHIEHVLDSEVYIQAMAVSRKRLDKKIVKKAKRRAKVKVNAESSANIVR